MIGSSLPSPYTTTSLLNVTNPTTLLGFFFFNSLIYYSIAAITHYFLDTWVTYFVLNYGHIYYSSPGSMNYFNISYSSLEIPCLKLTFPFISTVVDIEPLLSIQNTIEFSDSSIYIYYSYADYRR